MSKARQLADLGSVTTRLDEVGNTDGALSNRNLIINGAMQVAQRGTSFAAIGASTYTLDRWRGQSRASSVINVSRVDNLDVDGRIMSVLQHQVTTAATDGLTLQNQFVEDGSISLLGQTVTVSCWARVTVGSATLEQQFEVDGGTYSFTSSATTLTTSFQLITFTTTLSGYTTAITDKHLRYQAYIRGASAHTVQITGVQLEVGDTATPFEHRSFGQELALCQRYFQAVVDAPADGLDVPLGIAFTESNGTVRCNTLAFPVTMRTIPTISQVGNEWSFYAFGGANQTITSGLANASVTSKGVALIFVSTIGNQIVFYFRAGATDVRILADAEL